MPRPARSSADSSSAMWSRSVRLRSPNGCASNVTASSLSERTWSYHARNGWLAKVSAHCAQRCCNTATLRAASGAAGSSSPADARMKAPSAAARTVGACDGRSRADSSSRHSSAAGVSNTLPVRVRTLGMPARLSAIITWLATDPLGTSTAMCPGETFSCRSSTVIESSSSISTTRLTRSSMMAARASGTERSRCGPPGCARNPARSFGVSSDSSNCRQRISSGAPAMARSVAPSAGCTSVPTMRGSPSSTPSISVLVAFTRSASLRKFRASRTFGAPSVARR